MLYGSDLRSPLFALSIRLLQLFLLGAVSDLFLAINFLVLLAACLINSLEIESLAVLWVPVRTSV